MDDKKQPSPSKAPAYGQLQNHLKAINRLLFKDGLHEELCWVTPMAVADFTIALDFFEEAIDEIVKNLNVKPSSKK